MKKDVLPLLKSSDMEVGERIKKLSQSVDRMFRAMSRRKDVLERIVKVKKIFNI